MQCHLVSLERGAYSSNVPDANYCFVRRVGSVAVSFVDRYTERTGKQGAESFTLEAYDSIIIIAAALNAAGSTDSDATIAAFEGITF